MPKKPAPRPRVKPAAKAITRSVELQSDTEISHAEPEVRFHLHPAGGRVRTRFPESWSPPTVRLQRHGLRYLGRFIAERDPLLRVGLRVRIRLPPAQSPGENPSPGIRLPPFQLFAEPRGQGSRPQRRVPVSRALRELVYCAATHPTHDHSTASSQCVLCLIFA